MQLKVSLLLAFGLASLAAAAKDPPPAPPPPAPPRKWSAPSPETYDEAPDSGREYRLQSPDQPPTLKVSGIYGEGLAFGVDPGTDEEAFGPGKHVSWNRRPLRAHPRIRSRRQVRAKDGREDQGRGQEDLGAKEQIEKRQLLVLCDECPISPPTRPSMEDSEEQEFGLDGADEPEQGHVWD